MKQREVTFLIIALLLAVALGAVVGDILASLLPADNTVGKVLQKTVAFGVPTVEVDFFAISVTLGLTLRINFMSVLFVLLVIVYFRWWYL
ncbi:MAG: DUF4321 domain-containing protein [Candidatus Zixiibacteriota bacterium]